jgi:hypothetical protein
MPFVWPGDDITEDSPRYSTTLLRGWLVFPLAWMPRLWFPTWPFVALQGRTVEEIMVSVHLPACLSPHKMFRTNLRIFMKIGTNIMPLYLCNVTFLTVNNTDIMAVRTSEVGATQAPLIQSPWIVCGIRYSKSMQLSWTLSYWPFHLFLYLFIYF